MQNLADFSVPSPPFTAKIRLAGPKCIVNASFDAYTYNINSIQENTNIIDSATNWNTLLIKKALHIRLKKPVLNSGLKASNELQLVNLYSRHIRMCCYHGFSNCF